MSTDVGTRVVYRPPTGMPRRTQTRWQGWIVSLLAHVLVLGLLLIPALGPNLQRAEGAGGGGPVGGGANGGTGGERLHFVQTAAAPPDASKNVATPRPAIPVPSPVPPPVQSPLQPPLLPTPSPTSPGASIVQGAGSSGTGTGTGGAGSGSGGGIGSGEGNGKGSGTGPGTGGGNAKNYPPTPRQFFLPPLPAPSSVRGFHMTAWFDVDSTGKATLMRFTPTPDGSYNKRLRETLLSVRFRPAVRPDGTPMRDTVNVEFTF